MLRSDAQAKTRRSKLLKLLAVIATVSAGATQALAVHSQSPHFKLAQIVRSSSSASTSGAQEKLHLSQVSKDESSSVPPNKDGESASTIAVATSPVQKKSLTIVEADSAGENHSSVSLSQLGDSAFAQPEIRLAQSGSEATEDAAALE